MVLHMGPPYSFLPWPKTFCVKKSQPDTCPEHTHTQTQIMHANQIQYFRVLHIIKSVVVVVVHAGHFKTCYAKVLTHSTLLPMILAGSGGVRGAFNSMHALH